MNGTSEPAARPASTATQPSAPPPAAAESEVEKLVKGLNKGDSAQLDILHTFIKAHPSKMDEIEQAITRFLPQAMALYVRRMLEARRTQDHPSPARPAGSPRTSPRLESFPTSVGTGINGPAGRALPRKSIAPRQSTMALDKTAPIDDQLAHLKTVFARTAAGNLADGDREREKERAYGGSCRVGAEPLRERAAPNSDSSVD
jgi:cytoskeleton-associated protein 5